MLLSQEQQGRVKQYLEARTATCTCCAAAEFKIMPELCSLVPGEAAAKGGAEPTWLVGVQCQRCFHLNYFGSDLVGIKVPRAMP